MMGTALNMSQSMVAVAGVLLLAGCSPSASDKQASTGAPETTATTTDAPEAAPVPVKLDASCDAALAEKTITQCKACHSTAKGAPSMAGPNLYGVHGRAAASLEGFAYSPSMRKSGITWTDEKLDAYLNDPQGVVPDNRMAFGGVHDAKARAAVICYLRALK